MKRYNLHIKGIIRELTMASLMLFALAGNALAQPSHKFVIKTTVQDEDHYLAHVHNGETFVLQDVIAFDPETCLWISDNTYTQGGTNKNYYFMDGTTPRFLCAPEFEAGGVLTISTTQPPTSYLNNPEYQYYFYKWDNGLGRGVQYKGVTQEWCNGQSHGWDSGSNECWEVYWVSYDATSTTWKLSDEYYDLSDVPTGGGQYYGVTITEHPETTETRSGGLDDLENFELEFHESHQIVPRIDNYQYAVTPAYVTYYFDESTHNYYDAGSGIGDQGDDTPDAQPSSTYQASSAIYSWTINGAGAGYLSIDDPTSASPTITYSLENTTGHTTATVSLTVTYGENGPQQTRTATVLIKTPCQNPPSFSATPNELGATVTWTPTADSYIVSWKRQAPNTTWNSVTVSNTTSYTITGLEYGGKIYQYKVRATCDSHEPDPKIFTTQEDPGLMIAGAIFGGGRMANVTGKTDVVVINCGSIGAVYGGNDIAGSVVGADGSTITLGVDEGGTYASYGTTPENGSVRVGSVYGGGNGYYAYNGTSFVAATNDYNSETVEVGGHINAMTQSNQVGEVVWTNTGTESKTFSFPSIVKTKIMVTNDKVKVDSIFGGAKNAFLTLDNFNDNGSTIIVDGGTIFAVFGGNNWGGTQKRGRHYIEVNHTTTKLESNIHNTTGAGYGRTFGIRYLFGGGNKVEGSSTYININGGQCDTVFAGGNAADVYYANLTVNCAMAANAGTDYVYGALYSNAIDTYEAGVITPKTTYGWDGKSGIYNVRTLFGGNNKAEMTRVPNITLTSGSVGTVYGGGNAGDMAGLGFKDASGNQLVINGNNVTYGTHVVLNSPSMLVDYLYGGCQMSNVANSTWVELKKGHVGTVYGGCNISGDVGSTRVYDTYAGGATYPTTLEEQEVKGATYVVAGGDDDDNIVVYNNIYAGSNGYYNCSNDGIHYNDVASPYFNDPTGLYNRKEIPTHNETNVIISKGVTVKGSVYAGGNLAPVGFDDDTGFDRGYPELIGMASVRMDDGLVEGNVYGGGNMASIFGSNEVRVSGGRIGIALYGGNDRAGKVAEKSKRILPAEYDYASDEHTKLIGEGGLGVKTYVSVSGWADIGTVYGGGNGAYPPGSIQYCYDDDEPVQSNTFVDININGGALPAQGGNGGQIRTVYGGGNGVTTWDGVTVFLNVKDPVYNREHVDTIFGGNNMGDLDVVPDIRLVHGQVGTVYGGCNQGAMIDPGKTIEGYEGIGSFVHLFDVYKPDNNPEHNETVDAMVTKAIYGGCRMNGVSGINNEQPVPTNSLVLVDGGNFVDTRIFGGSDISGHVSGWSRVVVRGGGVGNVYGGGNGDYVYENNNVYLPDDLEHPIAVGTSEHPIVAPTCANSGVDIWSGQVGASGNGNGGNVFGGGLGANTSTTGNVEVNIGVIDAVEADPKPLIYGNIYGGSALGSVNTDGSNTTKVNFLNGTLHGNLFGGGLGDVNDNRKGWVNGKVYVYISKSEQQPANCFIDLTDADIYGCNNTNGSPQDDVEVHVYKTGFITGNYDSQSGNAYAIDEVFGGGNQADYAPQNGNENSTKKATVYVHDCLNTIRRVFSGGNAAAATGVAATIEGGRFEYVFGGGNGEVHNANIGKGGTNLLVEAGIITHLFGGSNQNGTITGPIYTEVNDDHFTSACKEEITEFFGGGNAVPISGDITSLVDCCNGTINEIYGGSKLAIITGDINLSVRGGTCPNVYGGSKGADGTAADITGSIILNLEGGTLTNVYGGSNINGNVTGNIAVNVIDYEQCPLVITNLYGGGNLTPYTPSDASAISPIVNVMHIKPTDPVTNRVVNVYGGAKGATATVKANPRVNIGYVDAMYNDYVPTDHPDLEDDLTNFPHAYVSGNVFGSGDQAAVGTTGEGAVICNTEVNVYNGEIVKKLVGGGNEAGVSGNVTVNISGGSLCTSTVPGDFDGLGVYGGCNNSGTVGGDVTLNITGTDETRTTIGTLEAVFQNEKPINIHGGGYGQSTNVAGDVTVNYGTIIFDDSGENPIELHSDYPLLYGDLYGGSALGSVNTNNRNVTEVNILNGEIYPVIWIEQVPGSPHPILHYYSGNIYGGGLGRKAEGGNSAIPAIVNGVVHVNIGDRTTQPSGGLKGKAQLYNCNVYGSNNKNGSPQDDVFVDVYQTNQTDGSNDTPNTVFDGNDYAILRVFGGGNEAHYAPDDGDELSTKKAQVYIHGCNNTIKNVYGGSNAANAVGVIVLIEGGRFDEVYAGGNGLVHEANIGQGGVGINVNAGHLKYLYFGCNKNGNVLGPTNEPKPLLPVGYTDCGQLFIDAYYFGDNEATHYGDLENIITCAMSSEFHYTYVYAGSRWASVYGDIKLTVQGGNIEYLFGGSKGSADVEGQIPADVKRFPTESEINGAPQGTYPEKMLTFLAENPEYYGRGGNIELVIQGGVIGDVVGGCDELGNVEGKITVIVADKEDSDCPLFVGDIYGAANRTNYEPTNTGVNPSPKVSILNAEIGGTATFSVGRVEKTFEGNVFGGANNSNITSNPKVIIGYGTDEGEVNVLGNVFGGGNIGNVVGNPEVVVVPETHQLTIEEPDHGSIVVTNAQGLPVTTGASIGEDIDLFIKAVPQGATEDGGYVLSQWEPSGTGASVRNTKAYKTMFTMGTTNAILDAEFVEAEAHTLTIVSDPDGVSTYTIEGAAYSSATWLAEGIYVTIVATPSSGYVFEKWTLEGAGSRITNATSPSTTFIMGEADATLTAHFLPVYNLTLVSENVGCTFKVNGVNYTEPVPIVRGTSVTIEAFPVEGFTEWEVVSGGTGAVISNTSYSSTTFKMGSEHTTLKANYGMGGGSGRRTNHRNSRR